MMVMLVMMVMTMLVVVVFIYNFAAGQESALWSLQPIYREAKQNCITDGHDYDDDDDLADMMKMILI